jgi:hypothetical protein
MFARSVVRAASKAQAFPAVPKAASSVIMTSRFSTSIQRRKTPEVVAEREVPTTSYSKGEAHHSTLKIRDEDKLAASSEQVAEERVYPLTQDIYERMTPSMRKMTLFGKVVVVTGYVESFFVSICKILAIY